MCYWSADKNWSLVINNKPSLDLRQQGSRFSDIKKIKQISTQLKLWVNIRNASIRRSNIL